jgi:alpha-galactosidase
MKITNAASRRVTFLLAGLCLAAGTSISAAAQSSGESYSRAVIRSGPEFGVRFSSGLSVCDEALRDGRWVSRYWLSTGVVKPEVQLEQEKRSFKDLPLDAFELSLDGQSLAGGWEWVNASQTEVRNPDGLLVTVELANKLRPVTVKIQTLLHGGPVMIRWLEITNTGAKAAGLASVSPWSGLLWNTPAYSERLQSNEPVFEVGHTQDQKWWHEGEWTFDPVVNATKTILGTHGKSGWGHPTFFAHNNATGEWFVGSLGWSGNWTIKLTGTADPAGGVARLFFSMGPSSADPVQRVIEPGESIRTPQVHLMVMHADFDHVVQALHDHIRRFVLPPPIPGREYQVEANHRGYIVDHEDEPGLKREAHPAAAVGAEMFVIDAGWYGPEPNRWASNVGDWYAGAWLPNDLTPVREYARSKGMLFGLWMEIESVGAASRLRREHPDWILTRNGLPVARGRQLDVSNPVVAAWMESEIARVIQKYDLDMFRLDYNTTMNEGGTHVRDGFVENTLWRHVDNLYAMFDRLRVRFPRVIFQNCAGGGGRLDLGIMRRFNNTEISDWMRAPRGLKILNGVTWVLPPEILLRTFGTETPEQAADGDLDLQLRTVMMARPIFRGISPTLDDFNPILRAKIRDSIALYKATVRPIMVGSKVFHHTPFTPFAESSPWVVLEYATPDQRRAVATLFRTSGQGDPLYVFRPEGLDISRSYRVTFCNRGQTVEISGAQLVNQGITVRLTDNLTSEMLIFDGR